MVSRRAIDTSGRLGSFYDLKRDCVLNKYTAHGERLTTRTVSSPQYAFEHGDAEESKNVLKIIGLARTQRLNILLGLTSRVGIAQLLDYPHPIDKYTRFLHICYADRQEKLPEDLEKAKMHAESSIPNDDATHFITAITYGVDVAVVLQLPPSDAIVRRIDRTLGEFLSQLDKSEVFPDLNAAAVDILTKVSRTTVYSNVSELTEMKSLTSICDHIKKLEKDPEQYPPLKYSLQSIEVFPDAHERVVPNNPINRDDNSRLEECLLEIFEQMKTIKRKLGFLQNEELADNSKDILTEATSAWLEIQEMYDNLISELTNIVLNLWTGQESAFNIDRILEHKNQKALKKNIRRLMDKVTTLEEQADVLHDRRHEPSGDSHSTEAITNNNNDHERTSQYKQAAQNESNITDNTSEKSIKNRKTKPDNEHKEVKEDSTLSSTVKQEANETSQTTKDEVINVLLLGESGVGKSTFINAFINYLVFKTLRQAESSKPVVVIPVSFLITTGNDFKENTVRFGEVDSSNNEDFDHPGQSVTQQCRSYLFDIDPEKTLKFRIIDTPGFGDTRGIDQDDLNMQHILEYITQYNHLDIVCFLLKPNVSQINSFFRICLTQLLDLLGPDIQQNIIFCFTGARSTFYTAGDTAPLLKKILSSHPEADIPFRKSNTFCFDNEAFRYLVALQNSIAFSDLDREEYEKSWLQSVAETKRLRDYMYEKMSAVKKQTEHQSIKGAEMQIKSLVRPILESMRNILRNLILYRGSPKRSIKLKPKSLSCPSAICLKCERDCFPADQLWIIEDVPHEINKTCCSCKHDLDQHKPIYYGLRYKYLETPCNDRRRMKEDLNMFVHASAGFAYFLKNIARSSQDDPFLSGLIQMIDEENHICKHQNPNEMNLKLVKHLREKLENYEERLENINSDSDQVTLRTIYKCIDGIREHLDVKIQIKAAERTRDLQEFKITSDLTSALMNSKPTS